MTNRRLLLTARGTRSQRLDASTRRRGKAGVTAARAELRRALAEATERDAA